MKQEFLTNLRIARNLYFHSRVEADSAAIDADTTQNQIARAAIWLTPKSVNGFDVADFSELGATRQRELQEAVQGFLNVAKQVPAQKTSTKSQLDQATVEFKKILEILAPYLLPTSEGDEVERALESVTFPGWVVNWDYELGSDEDGQPAVWVNLFADETNAPRSEFGRLASSVTKRLYDALPRAGNNRWPFVRVRTAVEHKMI